MAAIGALGTAPTRTAWATEVEKEELENGGEIKVCEPTKIQVGGGDLAFPSLGDAVKVKETKKEKKKSKPVPMSLAQLHKGTSLDNISLPKGPRAKDENVEESAGFRNGFRDSSFGRSRTSRSRDLDNASDAGSADLVSRADMSDNWGSNNKFQSSRGGGFGSSRNSSFGRSDNYEERSFDSGPSRADAASTWGSRQPSRGFDDRPRDRGFEDRPQRNYDFSNYSNADGEDRWTRKSSYPDSQDGPSRWGGSLAPSGGEGPPPEGRPRLKLAPRTLPLPEVVVREDPPPTNVSPPPEPEVFKPVATKPKPNPFGAARPREEVLKEKEAARKAVESLTVSGEASSENQATPEDTDTTTLPSETGVDKPEDVGTEADEMAADGLHPEANGHAADGAPETS